MADLTTILGAIEEMNKAHESCVNSLKEEMKTGLRASAIQIEAEMEVVNNRLKELSDHVATQNSSVFKLKEESEKRKVAVDDFRKLEGQLKWFKKRWIAILVGFIIFVAIIAVIVDITGVKIVIEKAWGYIP